MRRSLFAFGPMLDVKFLRNQTDNYAYILTCPKTGEMAVVDPVPVKELLEQINIDLLKLNLTTHWHPDHASGNDQLARLVPHIATVGASNKVQGVSKLIKSNDVMSLGSLKITCIGTPCHTQDSVCYYVQDEQGASCVFTGDTLISGGCGRFFEGTAQEMHAALTRLMQLPDDTVVYDGHDYVASNLKFGLSVEPENKDMQALKRLAEAKQDNTIGKCTIGGEKKHNVFMRWAEKEVQQYTKSTEPVSIIAALRESKNNS